VRCLSFSEFEYVRAAFFVKNLNVRNFDFEWHIARGMPVQFDRTYRTGPSEGRNVIQINLPHGLTRPMRQGFAGHARLWRGCGERVSSGKRCVCETSEIMIKNTLHEDTPF
jgi:hypothetical protein